MTFLPSLRDQLFIMAGVKLDLEQELVPALFGSGIAKKGMLNGACYSLFSNEQNLKTALRASLKEVRDLFDQARVRLQTACTQHFEDLQKELKDEAFDFPQRLKSERKILHVCTYLNPFIKQFLKKLDLPYLQFLNEGLNVDAWLSYLTYARLVQKAKNLELTTGLAVPFRVLSRINVGKKLNAKDTDEINDWLKALADAKSEDVATFKGYKRNPYVQVHSMHRFLSELSDLLEWDLAAIEIKFYKMGCSLFYEPDPYWMKVRKRVAPGDSFWIEDKEYIVDACLVNPQNLPDRSMMFSLQDEPDLTLVIDPNEAFCSIQLKMQERHHYGVIMPKIFGQSKAVSLIERTYHPLSSIVWESEGELSNRDIIQAHPIVELLTGLCLQPCTLYPLTPNRFVFNKDNEMRALEIMRIQVGKKSFEDLEDFVWQCASNSDGTVNAPVFTYLMGAGQLIHLPQAKSYQDLMGMALINKKIDTSVTFNGIFTEPTQLEQRKNFFLGIQALKTAIIQEILSVYQVMDVKKLHESLVSAFGVVHLRDSPGRLLLPSFSDQCKLHILMALELRMRPDCLSPIRAALIDKISQSDLGNAEIQAGWQEEKKYYVYGIYNKNQQAEIYYQGKIKYKLNKKY